MVNLKVQTSLDVYLIQYVYTFTSAYTHWCVHRIVFLLHYLFMGSSLCLRCRRDTLKSGRGRFLCHIKSNITTLCICLNPRNVKQKNEP